MTTRRLAELCCGSAALTLRLHGSEPLMPYMGGKGRYAQAIVDLFALERPESVMLVDPGPWCEAWGALMHERHRSGVADLVEQWATMDPHKLFDTLRKTPADGVNHILYTATHLVLQRLAFRGKAVTEVAGRWNHPGISDTAAVGRAGTDSFQAVAPQLPQLPRRIRELPYFTVSPYRLDAAPFVNFDWTPAWDVYIDPPYLGTTGYGKHDLPRDQVVELALSCRAGGARVIVSEATPIASLVEQGFHATEITHMRVGKRSSWQSTEWVTSSMPPVQVGLF